MADKKESSQKKSSDSGEQGVDNKTGTSDQLLKRLERERENVEEILRRDYKNTRRYVRSHPEEGVLISFVGGLVLGLIIGKLTK